MEYFIKLGVPVTLPNKQQLPVGTILASVWAGRDKNFVKYIDCIHEKRVIRIYYNDKHEILEK